MTFVVQGKIEIDSTGAIRSITVAKTQLDGLGERGKNAGKKLGLLNEWLNRTGQHAQVATGHVANLAANFNDVGVMLASGQSPLMLALQQGTQISQVLGPMGAQGAVRALGSAFMAMINPVSLATIALTGGVAVLGQWALGINRAEDEARKAKERFETLADVIDALGDVSRASAADIDRYIRGTFNDVAGAVQALIDDLRQAEFGLLSTEMRHSIEETTADLSRLSGGFEVFWQDFAKGPNRIRASSFRPRPCARPWKSEMPGVWSARPQRLRKPSRKGF
ncbi:hypothetical protein BV509_11140 [Rhodovulum sulfidophilum]|uniref:Phage tail length tape measure family protein n=1 Tax=Rhodovulum visakhapatnamense TaxID=364297 RepID=A0ABS1RKH4_9RHOB|nr:phage tail length tape measure family protein [Rhodovulum visakhapatnamense]MBL3570925.1 phage tail length tape measure family protein [Rhodovulum visakhapatnamense]MBL3580138.1 phage tail length tape measure family protein [Rhodovulum visakhapatnamense]OLS44838.1 hypothetical protein BV509_11140 [Rhodovulum sulfidophilum]